MTRSLDMSGKYLMRNTTPCTSNVSLSPRPTCARCKGAGFFSSMNDDVWMLAGHRGLGKGFHCCALPWRTEPTRPAGERPSWNITAEQQTAFCWLYTVNFMPDFLPTPCSLPSCAADLPTAAPSCCYIDESPWFEVCRYWNNKYSSDNPRTSHARELEERLQLDLFLKVVRQTCNSRSFTNMRSRRDFLPSNIIGILGYYYKYIEIYIELKLFHTFLRFLKAILKCLIFDE